MESKELITEEITLTEEGLKNKQLEKRKNVKYMKSLNR